MMTPRSLQPHDVQDPTQNIRRCIFSCVNTHPEAFFRCGYNKIDEGISIRAAGIAIPQRHIPRGRAFLKSLF